MWFRKPKVNIDIDNALQFYYGASPGNRYDIKPELSIWLFEYCKGKWSIKPKYKREWPSAIRPKYKRETIISVDFIFSEKSDALHFKLVHGNGIQT